MGTPRARTVAVVLLALTLLAVWLPPVDTPVARAFAYDAARPFLAGQYRGTTYTARRGTPVRSVCAGRVASAREVAHRRAVSVRCGRYRVSYLPLARIAVRREERVRRGAVIGTAAGALHLGARIEHDQFGYVDPERLIARPLPP